jgi:hypothetical protein
VQSLTVSSDTLQTTLSNGTIDKLIIPTIKGATGVTGTAGSAGAVGPQGPAGPQGFTGPTGAAGSANAWGLTGNTSVDTSNYIGSLNNADVKFKVNNNIAGLLDASSNQTFFGYQAGGANSVGIGNTGIGYQALSSNTGSRNVALGSFALVSATGLSQQVAVGDSALYRTSGGSGGNTALGSSAMQSNSTGAFNTATGYFSLHNNSTGTGNTANGYEALYNNIASNNTGDGYEALMNNTNGAENTALGGSALSGNISGNYNTAVGYRANVNSGTFTNATAIGYSAIADTNNQVRLGNTSVTSIGGQVGWTNFSDARIKDNVQQNVPGLSFINRLRPVTYHFNIAKENALRGIANTTAGVTSDIEKVQFTGFLAQEVDAAAKKTDYDFSGVDKNGPVWGLRYSEFVVPVIKAVQELSSKNDSLEAQNANLQSSIETLRSANAALQAQMQQAMTRMDQFESSLSQCCSSYMPATGQNAVPVNQVSDDTATDAAALDQNVPNPFNASTYIRYYIPATASNAQLLIVNLNGEKMFEYNIGTTGFGKQTITPGQFAPGIYYYTLFVDNKLVATRQMVMTR